MLAARAGDEAVAARCELALLGIRHPTPTQVAGATLRAMHAEDIHLIRTFFFED